MREGERRDKRHGEVPGTGYRTHPPIVPTRPDPRPDTPDRPVAPIRHILGTLVLVPLEPTESTTEAGGHSSDTATSNIASCVLFAAGSAEPGSARACSAVLSWTFLRGCRQQLSAPHLLCYHNPLATTAS